MTAPVEDELRAVLRRHADLVAVAPDPLPGLERRVRRLRRRRAAARSAAVLAAGGLALLAAGLLPLPHRG